MSSPFGAGFGGQDPQSYLALLLRLMPDGYSQDPDGPRVTELEAYATALWVGRIALDRAFAQVFPNRSTELLEEWEHAYGLPNDAARTIEQRQARLRAAELAVAGASRDRIEAALQAVAPSASAVASKRTHIEASAALDEMIYQIGVQLDLDEWSDPAVRRGVARILRRMLPAHHHPVPGFRVENGTSGAPDTEGPLYVTEGATWGGSQILGQTVLHRQSATTYAVREPTNRYREYGPLVKLTADDLNALQDLTLMGPCTGAGVVDAYADAGTDMAIVHVATRVGAGVPLILDESIDWRDRYVLPVFHYSTSDIRPGQATDTTAIIATAIDDLMSTLAGDDATLAGTHLTFATDLHLYASNVDGQLYCYNASASAVSIVGMFIASPSLGVH